MKATFGLALLLVLGVLAPCIALADDNPGWQHIGYANEVVAMAAMHGKLFAVSKYNKLWVRDPLPRDMPWQLLGSANRIVALAAVEGKLFGATADHKLWMRDAAAVDAAWHHIGYADAVVAMTALDGKLYAATRGNRLWMCTPAPWNIRWQSLGDAMQAVALAGLDGKLYAITKDRKLWMRDPSAGDVPWQYLGDQEPVVSLAGLGGKLFAATSDNKLWMRTPAERTPSEGLRIAGVSLEAPDWLGLQDAALKVVVTMSFNRAIQPSTVAAPAAVKIDVQGLTSGRAASGVSGTFQHSSDAKTAVFISDRTLAELIQPQANEMIEYRITLAAPELRAGVRSTARGSTVDKGGEENVEGRFVKVMRRRHVASPQLASPQPEGRVF
jgi:hypothetical protein